MADLFQLPKVMPLYQGAVMPGSKLYFYRTGTSTPQNTYTDSDLTTPHANPVVADANGVFAPIFLDPNLPDYRVTLTNSLDVVQSGYPVDDYPALSTAGNGQKSYQVANDIGTANSLAITLSNPSPTEYTNGMMVLVNVANNTTSTTPTININSLGSRTITRNDGAALVSGAFSSGKNVILTYDSSSSTFKAHDDSARISIVENYGNYQEYTISSSATTDIGLSGLKHNIVISGTATITSFGSSASISSPLYYVRLSGNVVIKNNSNITTHNGRDIAAISGDSFVALYQGSGQWKIVTYEYGQSETIISSTNGTNIIASTTTLTDVPGMSKSIVANAPASATSLESSKYQIELMLNFFGTSTTTQGYKFALQYSGSYNPTTSVGAGIYSSNATAGYGINTIGTAFTSSAIRTGAYDVVHFKYLLCPATSGTLKLQYAQNSSSANETNLQYDSVMIVKRIS